MVERGSGHPILAYDPIVIPYPGTPGDPFFDGQNITDFLERYSQLCADYRLSESEKLYRLPWHCEFSPEIISRFLSRGGIGPQIRQMIISQPNQRNVLAIISIKTSQPIAATQSWQYFGRLLVDYWFD